MPLRSAVDGFNERLVLLLLSAILLQSNLFGLFNDARSGFDLRLLGSQDSELLLLRVDLDGLSGTGFGRHGSVRVSALGKLQVFLFNVLNVLKLHCDK